MTTLLPLPAAPPARVRTPADVAMDVRVEEAPLLVRPEHVGGRVAWTDLVRCGALVRVREDAAVRPTTDLTPAVRALSLAPLVPPRTVVGGVSAAWVHCGVAAGAVLEVVHPLGVHRPPPRHGRVARQSALLRPETIELGTVLVTTVERTAVDIACLTDPHVAVPVLRALLEQAGLDVGAALRILDLRHRRTGRPQARALLTDFLARSTPQDAGSSPGAGTAPRLP
ncbi:hypothetical protein ACFP63_13970 [Oerskovia jenensis]|uniref:AbiEi antitoxin C-terminal domain-containing protein n=1 Tax=Oerskovia jenensis TaxID=162169 RepID=A0ABS2LA56_9CELL|nr:hypothetical protein [Oerskovia jenensis]MBM7477267.1 hypothetical protein [Oerskovia jenensis]